jgi:hypothetical protein
MNSRHLAKVALILGVALVLTPAFTASSDAGSGLSFAPAIAYGTSGLRPRSVAEADLNGDGKLDLVVANLCVDDNCEHGAVSVLLGNRDGTFKTAVTYSSGGYNGGYQTSVAVADVNGDGKRDLVVSNACATPINCASIGNGVVGVLLGNGDGTFKPVVTYNSGGHLAFSVKVGDVNGDGKPDLFVANLCSDNVCSSESSVGVLLGNGDGTFKTAVTYDSGGGAALSVAVGDVNGDGKPDLVVTNQQNSLGNNETGVVGVLLGNGDGTFRTAVTYGSGGNGPFSVAVADVNGDGKLDLLVANQRLSTSFGQPGGVGVLLGNGDGTFKTAVAHGSGGNDAVSIAVADVNGDGKPDVLVANNCSTLSDCSNSTGSVGVLLGNGDGTFQMALTYGSDGNVGSSVAVGDVNADHKPDVLVTNECGASPNCSGLGTVGVLINTSGPIDTTPPFVTVSAHPTTLWPPNGAMVPVTISGAITDSGSGVNAKTAAYAVMDEYGQIQPSGPIILGLRGNYSTIVWLQASREESDEDGRQYTITVSARDNANNLGSASTVVTVPHGH